jgi:hypothetical protein
MEPLCEEKEKTLFLEKQGLKMNVIEDKRFVPKRIIGGIL